MFWDQYWTLCSQDHLTPSAPSTHRDQFLPSSPTLCIVSGFFFWLQVQRGLWSSANKGILPQNGCWSNSEAIAPSGVALPCQHTLPDNSLLQTLFPKPLLPTPHHLQVLPADFSVLRTLLTIPSSCLWPSSAGLSHQAVRLCRALPWFSGPAWAKP